jgi:hypothetical protein
VVRVSSTEFGGFKPREVLPLLNFDQIERKLAFCGGSGLRKRDKKMIVLNKVGSGGILTSDNFPERKQ